MQSAKSAVQLSRFCVTRFIELIAEEKGYRWNQDVKMTWNNRIILIWSSQFIWNIAKKISEDPTTVFLFYQRDQIFSCCWTNVFVNNSLATNVNNLNKATEQDNSNTMDQYSKLHRDKDWTLKLMRNTEYTHRDFESRNLALIRIELHTMKRETEKNSKHVQHKTDLVNKTPFNPLLCLQSRPLLLDMPSD